MTLPEKILILRPNLNMEDFLPTTGTIWLQNNSDGNGDYIKEWNHPTETRPTDEELENA